MLNQSLEGVSRDTLGFLQQLEREVVVSGAYTARETDDLILVDTTSAGVTVTLPRAINGRRVTILRHAGANNVTVNPVGSDTINGAGSATISSSYSPLCLKASAALAGWVSV